MLALKSYDRDRAVEYARRWALSRNPLFFDFTGGGGNCTNFASQCLLAGSLVMDPEPTFGWYYVSVDDRAPAWSGVGELYGFLCGIGDFSARTERRGPFCSEVMRERLEVGDLIQLANEAGEFYHTLVVSGFLGGDILVCAQSNDALDRPLSTYSFAAARFLHVEGVLAELSDGVEYFDALIDGTALPSPDLIYELPEQERGETEI